MLITHVTYTHHKVRILQADALRRLLLQSGILKCILLQIKPLINITEEVVKAEASWRMIVKKIDVNYYFSMDLFIGEFRYLK